MENTTDKEEANVPSAVIHDGPKSQASVSQKEPLEDAPRPQPDETDCWPKVAGRMTLPILLVILVVGAERFAYYAVTIPWQNYIQNSRDASSVPGALGLGQAAATSISNAYNTLAFLTPLPMGFISDLWLGKYKTLLLAFGFYFCGCLIQFTTSLPSSLDHDAGGVGLGVSMVLIAIGSGGVKAVISPFLGDQYVSDDDQKAKQQKDGKWVVVDQTLTLRLIYQISYWVTNIACMSTIPSTFLERIYGFWTAYLLAFVALCLAVGSLVAFSSKLIRLPAQGNEVVVTAMATMGCAMRHGLKMDHAKAEYQLAHHGRQPTWSDSFVDEVKKTLHTCRLLLAVSVFYLCIGQMANNFVSQAGQTQLSGVPNDMITSLAAIFCIVLGPLVQGIYALLARRNIIPSASTLITLAFAFCAIGMAYAAGIQHAIYVSPPCFNHPRSCPASNGRPNSISVWIQTPVYTILALAEILGFVTVGEYAYSQSPAGTKSIVSALAQLSVGLGSLLGLALSPAAHDPNMVIYYSSIAGFMAVATVAFWWLF